MPEWQTVPLDGFKRSPGEPLNVWFGQPATKLPDQAPFGPLPGTHASGLQILQAIFGYAGFIAAANRPTVVALPELSVRFEDVPVARQLIKMGPPGVLVVFGIGHMTADQALSLEPNTELWEGEPAGKFANCAAVCIGGSDALHLQPKLKQSRFEADVHWKGRVLRDFVTDGGMRFVVFICSDLLNEPEEKSTLEHLQERLFKKSETLQLAFWLQHNEKPRSAAFRNAVHTLGKMQSPPTLLVAGSRPLDGSKRHENYAVSGALISRFLVPADFDLLARKFHYTEAVDGAVARTVLLRYDVDVYHVQTVLADSLQPWQGPEKGAWFESTTPYALVGGALAATHECAHLREICWPARQKVVTRAASVTAAVDTILTKIVQIGTNAFLAFLDMAIVGRPGVDETPHGAGSRHGGLSGHDLQCKCWAHRVCIDLLTEEPHIHPLAAILEMLALLETGGCAPTPKYRREARSNLDLAIGGEGRRAIIVFPANLDVDGLREEFFGERRASVNASTHLFVADPPNDRPRAQQIEMQQATPQGAVDPSRASAPLPDFVRAFELRAAAAEGRLAGFLMDRLGAHV